MFSIVFDYRYYPFPRHLYAANGKVVYNNTAINKTTILEIDLSRYASGIYFINASDGNKKYMKKVVVGK